MCFLLVFYAVIEEHYRNFIKAIKFSTNKGFYNLARADPRLFTWKSITGRDRFLCRTNDGHPACFITVGLVQSSFFNNPTVVTTTNTKFATRAYTGVNINFPCIEGDRYVANMCISAKTENLHAQVKFTNEVDEEGNTRVVPCLTFMTTMGMHEGNSSYMHSQYAYVYRQWQQF